jgi:hypothetical protein
MHNRHLHHVHRSRGVRYRAAGRWLRLTSQQVCSDGPVDVGIELAHHPRAWSCQTVSCFHSPTSCRYQMSFVHTHGTHYPSHRYYPYVHDKEAHPTSELTNIVLVFWHTIEWFISILAQCVPLVAVWDLSYDDTALCMSPQESKHWALANYCE